MSAHRPIPATPAAGLKDRARSLGIVFLCHNDDEVTRNNLDSFRATHPEIEVIVVSSGSRVANGYTLEDLGEHGAHWKAHTSDRQMLARSGDLLLYAWYLNKREHHRKWLIVEWDSYCASSALDFVDPVWHFGISGASIRLTNREPEWHWFSMVSDLPRKWQPYAAASSPAPLS